MADGVAERQAAEGGRDVGVFTALAIGGFSREEAAERDAHALVIELVGLRRSSGDFLLHFGRQSGDFSFDDAGLGGALSGLGAHGRDRRSGFLLGAGQGGVLRVQAALQRLQLFAQRGHFSGRRGRGGGDVLLGMVLGGGLGVFGAGRRDQADRSQDAQSGARLQMMAEGHEISSFLEIDEPLSAG